MCPQESRHKLKTKLCRHWERGGRSACVAGDSCVFAHGQQELATFLLLTADYLLLIARYSLLTTHYSLLLTTHTTDSVLLLT